MFFGALETILERFFQHFSGGDKVMGVSMLFLQLIYMYNWYLSQKDRFHNSRLFLLLFLQLIYN